MVSEPVTVMTGGVRSGSGVPTGGGSLPPPPPPQALTQAAVMSNRQVRAYARIGIPGSISWIFNAGKWIDEREGGDEKS